MAYLRNVMAIFVLLLGAVSSASACTNLIVTRGASIDSSVIITYTCDGVFHPTLERMAAADYPSGDSLALQDWHGNIRGYVKQVPHTYAIVGLMNEHQLAIAETTFDGRLELQNEDGLLHYWDLMSLALQRSRTAREAIDVITGLVGEYGYYSTGETFSIGDTREAWLLEMIGPGKGGKGANWVAMRVPDGTISAHANKARIGAFPLDDPENCLYSKDVISFAVEKGYYDPDSGEPFLFNEAYCPSTPRNRRWGDTRVWSLFRRAAPSLNLSPDYHRSVKGAQPYPLWIRPDKPISMQDVFDLMRDHYEDTPYDMTKGIDAGAFGCPTRWRPLDWQVDSVDYAWERSISTQQTGFSHVSQGRDWLPNPIGGVYWYGVDDTYFTCYTPLYCCMDTLPYAYTVGSLQEFSWESAWWVFNFVANYANLRYADMRVDIQSVQTSIEGEYLALQPAIEQAAVTLYKTSPERSKQYLQDYSLAHADELVNRWRSLGEQLMVKYNDGYVKDDKGRSRQEGYPEDWLRHVVQQHPSAFSLPIPTDSLEESRLVD